jgi:hypothetical protein
LRVGLRKRLSALPVLALGLSGAERLRAEEWGPPARDVAPPTALKVGPSYHLFAGAALGESLRFNNPYRLHQELGDSAESLSLTPPYLNLKIGGTTRRAGLLSHGAELDASFALSGVPQEVLTPSYVILFHATPRWSFRGRGGIPIVVEPDFNAGFEVAAGGILFLTGALGVTLDAVGSIFFGAASIDTSRPAIPLASLELGMVYEYEVLP